MTVELGSWYIHLMYGAVFMFLLAGWLFVAYRKTQTYKTEVRGKIKAVVKTESGFPLVKVVPESQDGWIRVGKGDYKLPNEQEQRKVFEALSDDEKLAVLTGLSETTITGLSEDEKSLLWGKHKVLPSAIEWSYYPDKVFPGAQRQPIRSQEWYQNDCRPITWLRDREPDVTAAMAQGHTRQMDATTAGIRAKELESKSRQMMDAFSKVANKNVLYLLGIVNLVLLLILLVKTLGISIETPGF